MSSEAIWSVVPKKKLAKEVVEEIYEDTYEGTKAKFEEYRQWEEASKRSTQIFK